MVGAKRVIAGNKLLRKENGLVDFCRSSCLFCAECLIKRIENPNVKHITKPVRIQAIWHISFIKVTWIILFTHIEFLI